jgi:type VI secretion system secreted protein VgrG
MALAALKDLTITSSDGKIVIAAKSEVWVGAAGSFIQINGNGVTTASPGKIQEKGASWSMEGAASHSANLPVFPSSSDDDYEIVEQGFVRLRNGTIPVDDYHYDLISDGEIHTQKGSYAAGETARVPGQTNLSLVSWIAKDSAGRYE